jgi:hypothetical protein
MYSTNHAKVSSRTQSILIGIVIHYFGVMADLMMCFLYFGGVMLASPGISRVFILVYTAYSATWHCMSQPRQNNGMIMDGYVNVKSDEMKYKYS